ncbi:hypothetical protein TrVFT333_008172 [Trichoderma virens FT-333]|nr:hypothetical protein TrVFT333_008172 [Trichoderma virens FT-333]
MARIANSTSTEDWLDRMNSLNYILNAEEGDDYTRVKIAVLDTGVDPSNAAARYIKGYKDYVSNNDSIMCDNTGHGTTSVNLVFSICESADIYAVRIFEHDKANENTRELAAEAIDWCMTEEMDIICMACGFFSNYDTLHEKVRRASEKMLIIAAPTNDGNASEIAYPAAYGEVLSMFSTNGAVRKSRFNPSNPPEKYNFAILGEDIKTPRGELDCGTSFSTAIAAGFAGRLMDFSRHDDTKCHIQNAEKMKNKSSMIQVLLHIHEWDDPYYCIKPWKLLPEELRNRIPFTMSDLPTDKEKRGARKRIWQMISLGCWD